MKNITLGDGELSKIIEGMKVAKQLGHLDFDELFNQTLKKLEDKLAEINDY